VCRKESVKVVKRKAKVSNDFGRGGIGGGGEWAIYRGLGSEIDTEGGKGSVCKC